MSVLVTGGAGYIGSVTVQTLLENGYRVIVVDDLSGGHRESLPENVDLVVGDIGNSDVLDRVFSRNRIEAVIHFAAESTVTTSMEYPGRCFKVNVTSSTALLEASYRYGIRKFVFSSSAAVYGSPLSIPISEEAPMRPTNPYGLSKVVFERILRWYQAVYGLTVVILRYFNAAGAVGGLGEWHDPETHLIPRILRTAMGKAPGVTILGTDYPTPDGTCVRDYVHVQDIATAHVLALRYAQDLSEYCFNLGLGWGYSVKEVVEAARRVTGVSFPVSVGSRRSGDPPILVADAQKARLYLGWSPKFVDLEEIIDTAWVWNRKHLGVGH